MNQELSDDQIKLSLKYSNNKVHLKWAFDQISGHFNHIGLVLKDVHKKQSWDIGLYHYCKQVWGISKTQSYNILKGEDTKVFMLENAPEELKPVIQSLST